MKHGFKLGTWVSWFLVHFFFYPPFALVKHWSEVWRFSLVSSFFLKLAIYLLFCGLCMCARTHSAHVKVRRSEDLVLPLHPVAPRYWTRVFRLGGKGLYPLNHLTGLQLTSFFRLNCKGHVFRGQHTTHWPLCLFQVYLADYGLSYRYCPNGNHKQYQENPRKGHNGTIEFTSLDAHRGVGRSLFSSSCFYLRRITELRMPKLHEVTAAWSGWRLSTLARFLWKVVPVILGNIWQKPETTWGDRDCGSPEGRKACQSLGWEATGLCVMLLDSAVGASGSVAVTCCPVSIVSFSEP